MNSSTIIVENLKCHGCANTITRAISKINGVSHVDVTPEDSSVKVEYNDNSTFNLIIDKLSSLGYPEEGTGNTLQSMKSYVSCAVGRLS